MNFFLAPHLPPQNSGAGSATDAMQNWFSIQIPNCTYNKIQDKPISLNRLILNFIISLFDVLHNKVCGDFWQITQPPDLHTLTREH